MTDITQGQDATAAADKPNVDDLFGAKDVDELFPADYKPPQGGSSSPIHDFIFSSPTHSWARTLDAFGYGFKQDWGASLKEGAGEMNEADEYLRKAGIYNDYSKGQYNIIKAANEAIMRPAIAAFMTGRAAMSAAFHGYQTAAEHAGEEVGSPELGRTLAALPEAFPAGMHQPLGIPHVPEPVLPTAAESERIRITRQDQNWAASQVPDVIEQAKQLGTIGEGEAGYFGTKPVPTETPAETAEAAHAEIAEHAPTEETPSPVVQPAEPVAQPPAAPDIHTVARQIAPETFSEFDALAAKKDTFRRWIDELREVRDQQAQENAPHAAEIADLEAKMADATPRMAKKYQSRLDPLVAERDAYVAEQTQRDSADMAKVRQQLMETDYRMRDLAPQVSQAYREAASRVPGAEVAPAEEATAAQPVTQEIAAHENPQAESAGEAPQNPGEGARQAGGQVQPEVAAQAQEERKAPGAAAAAQEKAPTATGERAPAGLPIVHAPSIAADVAEKLKAAGRPADEAEAAGQIVAAYWETRAARFDGKKGTAAEMYAREAPEIVAGKEKPSKTKKARELELAQKGERTFDQAPTLGSEAFRNWFGASQVVDEEGVPLTVFHGTPKTFDTFDTSRPGRNSGTPEAKGIFFSDDPNVAGGYAKGFFARGNVMPVYLKMDRPRVIDMAGRSDPVVTKQLAIDSLFRDDEHDGIIFKNMADDPERRTPSDIYVVKSPNQVKSVHNEGAFDPNDANIYHQGVQGRIRIRDEARNTITLMKTADASTFIHETGHDWLDRMLKDARDPDAPASLKEDSNTVMKWLGVDSPDAIKTRHHEKFARGFETYMMEGRAPSSALARVFAKFKTWLTTIYKTVYALKAPISDDIRAVFDRMLAETPQRTVIAPEKASGPSLAERHEQAVDNAISGTEFGTAGKIRGERDVSATTGPVKEHENARLENAREGTEEHPAGGAEPGGDANAPGLDRGAAEASGGTGTIGAGRGAAAQEGTGPRAQSERLVKHPTPLINFLAAQGGIKASDANIADLRQSLGGKNHYVPGFGQLIRTPKQLSSAAAKAGRLEAMSIDRAREAAIEAGLLPEGTSIAQFLDAVEDEVRGIGRAREVSEEENAHAEHSFLEGLNDRIREAGGVELSEEERARALELYHKEGIHDPQAILERLALEADDAEIAGGAPERAPGVVGWDEPAPGWDTFDERPDASGARLGAEGAQPGEPGGAAARAGGEGEGARLDATADLPRSETQLVDKAGNIRLDNLGTPEDVNAVIRATAKEMEPYETAITRGRIPDSEVLKLSEALGMDPDKLSQRRLGEAFNAEQIVAARKLLIQSATKVRDLAAKIAVGTDADVAAYAEARARHLMIQEQVSGITAEAGRALRAFRSLEGSKEAADLSAFLKNTQGKTLYQMKEEGALLAMMGTPQQISKAVHDANLTRWQKTRSGILSWFINDLISGPITHLGYSIGNTVVQLFKATVDTPVAATLSHFRDLAPEEKVYFGEVGAQLYGMVRGMRDGFTPAMTALKTGVPFMKGDVEGMLGQIEAAYRPQAIPGKVGYVIETPSRAVTAIHTLHYGMNYEAEIGRRAFRNAMKEGLEPSSDAFNTSVAKFTQSPPPAEMEAAHNEALKMVLMKSAPFGTAQYHLQKAVNSNILAKIVMPFMQVGSNILHESFIERTPIGLMSQAVRDNLSGKNGEVARQTQASRIAVGIGLSTAVLGLTAEGILTGGGPSDPKQLAIKEMTGWRPYSIKVGEYYVPYRKYLGGMGPLIAGTADIYEVGHALTDEGLTKAAASSLFGFAEVIADESWARGLANFIDAARHWDRDGGRYLRNLAADFIPFAIGLQQVTSLADPYRREVRGMLDAARAHVPGMSQSLYPVRDIWGEPIASHTALGPAHAVHDPATQALLDAGYYPAKMRRDIRGVQLTDQQYDDLTRLAGRMARMRVTAFANTPGFAMLPKGVRAQKLRDMVDSAREAARAMVMMQSMNSSNNVVKQANDNKTAKLRGEKAGAH